MVYAFLCFCAFGLDYYTGGGMTDQVFSVYRSTEMMDPRMYMRFIFHVCGYNDLQIFFRDLLLILAVGPYVEKKTSSMGTLLMIGLIAFITSVVHFFMFPGVSIMGGRGIITALLIVASHSGKEENCIPLSFIGAFLAAIGYYVLMAYTGAGDSNTMPSVIEGLIGTFIGAAFTFK